MPFDEAGAIRFAASLGIDEPGFQALPDAAKYAWSWRAFNEPAYAALGAAVQRPCRAVRGAVCPARSLVATNTGICMDLRLGRQTEDFVARSTVHRGEAGYYAIFRNTAAAAEAWRATMPLADQEAVRSVVAASPLARFWPDLMRAALTGSASLGT